MVIDTALQMIAGEGKTSYARNSVFQKTVISKVRPVVEEAIKDLYSSILTDSCIRIADLGCSSGPNTLDVITHIFYTIYGQCREKNQRSPELEVFLNDLSGNDFNMVFKRLPGFYEKVKKEIGEGFGPYFITGLPGSFYGRLFPTRSLHFVHSSYSLHWLSKVPEGIANNKGNIYMSSTSPPNVFKAYKEQFQKDFFLFLRLRSSEMIPGSGRMVLTFIGRSVPDPTTKDCVAQLELLSKSLMDLAAQGLVREIDVDSFNVPFYTPFKGEMEAAIEEEGSFEIERLETFEMNWDPNDDPVLNKDYVFDKYVSGQNVANNLRAVTEPLLAAHFGDAVMDRLYARFAERLAEHLGVEKTKIVSVVISILKK